MPSFASETLLRALVFAAKKHRYQRRKGGDQVPYINHPIEVAELLARVGRVDDTATLAAAILHDTIEDTDATPEELDAHFGEEILELVQEVSDDKRLPKQERKRLQIELAHTRSPRARHIMLADKICNIKDMCHSPLPGWSTERTIQYFHWAHAVGSEIQGTNAPLEALFARHHQEGLDRYAQPEPDE